MKNTDTVIISSKHFTQTLTSKTGNTYIAEASELEHMFNWAPGKTIEMVKGDRRGIFTFDSIKRDEDYDVVSWEYSFGINHLSIIND